VHLDSDLLKFEIRLVQTLPDPSYEQRNVWKLHLVGHLALEQGTKRAIIVISNDEHMKEEVPKLFDA
jgi:hypothetical protein